MRVVERLARKHMHKQISRPGAAREGDARLHDRAASGSCPSNRWYPALGKPNVELVTEGVSEVRAHSIVAADGSEREVDAIVFGTGFHVTDIPAAQRIRGRDGRLLDDLWQGSPRAHLGLDDRRASRTCSSCSARTPGSGTARWST